MVQDTVGLHHFHKRKRRYVNKEPYPHPDMWKRFMDNSVYVIGVLGPILTIPQLITIWVDKNVAGVSGVTWGAYLIGANFWLAYGVMHKEKPIILTYSLWIIIYIAIVVGILMYR